MITSRNRLCRRIIFLTSAIGFLVQNFGFGQSERIDGESLLNRWSEMTGIPYYGSIKWKWVIDKDNAAPEPYSSGRLLVGTNGWASESQPGRGNQFGVAGLNGRYGFKASQPPPLSQRKNEQPLIVREIADLHNKSSESSSMYQKTTALLREKTELSFMHQLPWARLIGSGGFHIESGIVEPKDGVDSIRLTFHCDPTDAEHKAGIPKVKNGVARFMSKEHFFVPIEWNGDVDFLYDDPNFYSVACTYEYDLTSWKHPLITNWTMYRRWQNDAVVRTYSYESIGKSPPASAFTLSAYGLPEPPFARGTPWWLIVALTAACAITGIGLVIWNRSRKLSTS